MRALIIILIILSGCSPKWHLKQADKHMRLALAKGAVQHVDTVLVERQVIVPELRIDTLYREVNFTDTIVVTKDNVITKVKVNTVEKDIYIKTICPPDTLKIDVPITVLKEIKTGLDWWWLVVAGFIGLSLGVLLLRSK